MNAGTLTQTPTASRYKANPTAGFREKRDDTASFMNMSAQNLKDARKTGTKAADKGGDGAADSKTQKMGDTGRNQASVDQGKKPESSELIKDGAYRDDNKKAGPGVGNTDKNSGSGKRHNEGAAGEAINFQATSPLMQEVPAPVQAGGAQSKQAVQDAAMPTKYIPEPGRTEQTLLSNTALAGYEQTVVLQTQELVQPPYAKVVWEQMAQETATRPAAGQGSSRKTSDTVRSIQSDTVEADMTAVVQGHKETQQSGEDMFFSADSRQNKTLNQPRKQTGITDEEPKDANQALEELKRNTDVRGTDLTDKTIQNRTSYGLKPASNAREQQIGTPVLEQLKTGVEWVARAGNKEPTIHLRLEGLGDIVAHLIGSRDKATMRTGVTNPETEKLVTSQMESLKDTLRPLNTEVQEVYHGSQNTTDFSGFSQYMWKRRGQQFRTGYSFHTAEDSGLEEELLMKAKRMMAESRMSRLYAYV